MSLTKTVYETVMDTALWWQRELKCVLSVYLLHVKLHSSSSRSPKSLFVMVLDRNRTQSFSKKNQYNTCYRLPFELLSGFNVLMVCHISFVFYHNLHIQNGEGLMQHLKLVSRPVKYVSVVVICFFLPIDTVRTDTILCNTCWMKHNRSTLTRNLVFCSQSA